LKFAVTVILKNDVLDPQGKVIEQTLKNMGMSSLLSLRQGKYFEINIKDDNEIKAKQKIEEMCQKLLVNLIIENYEIKKI
jgi:phosphoribosylformylglycinamidine synthase PurS subunit